MVKQTGSQMRLPIKRTKLDNLAISFIEHKRTVERAKDTLDLAETELIQEMHVKKITVLMVESTKVSVQFKPGKEKIKIG